MATKREDEQDEEMDALDERDAAERVVTEDAELFKHKIKGWTEGTFYPLRDWNMDVPVKEHRHYRAKWTGEFRRPKAGEWYLSGAKVEAYKATNDLGQKYHIARVVRVKVRTIEVEEE